jgi:tetratricopeptide (TPR) repeat protein
MNKNELFKNLYSQNYNQDPVPFGHITEIKKIGQFISDGKLDKALVHCRQILHIYPDQFHILFLMGKIYYLKRKYNNSRSYLEKTLQHLNMANSVKQQYSPFPEKVFKNSLYLISTIILKFD